MRSVAGSAPLSPPGQGEGGEAPQPREPLPRCMEELAAPDRAVGPVARAVEGERERLLQPVLRHDGERVGEVVLDGDPVQGEALRPPGRMVEGVHVVHDKIRRDAIEFQDLPDRSSNWERVTGSSRSPMKGQRCSARAAREGRGVLQVASERQHDAPHFRRESGISRGT